MIIPEFIVGLVVGMLLSAMVTFFYFGVIGK